MIDFRYHLVSIIAVFLALATGIVLGTTTLNGHVIQRVKGVADTLSAENGRLRGQVAQLNQQVEADQQLIRQVAPTLVDGQLEGRRVAVVQAPGAGGELRNQVVTMLERAGATVGGRLSITRKYLRDGEAGVVGELAGRLAPEGMSLPNGAPYERSAAVLAEALMTGGGNGVTGNGGAVNGGAVNGGAVNGGAVNGGGTVNGGGADNGDRSAAVTALSGFETAGYVTTAEKPTGRATLALVIAPNAPYKGADAAADNRALVTLAGALDQHSGGAVVVGGRPATSPGGLIRALRGDGQVAGEVSTVDFAGTATGRVATVFALVREGRGETGHYGIGAQAGSYLPPLPPSPEASAAAGR